MILSINYKIYNTETSSWEYFTVLDKGDIGKDQQGDEYNRASLVVLATNTSEETFLEEDVTANGITNEGGISNNDTLEKGLSFTDFVKKFLIVSVPPSYVSPTISSSVSPSSTQEIGSTPYITMNLTYAYKDAGGTIKTVYSPEGYPDEESNGFNWNNSWDSTITMVAGGQSIGAEIFYAEGPVKEDNLGTPFPDGRIPAGSVSTSVYISTGYYSWYGPGQPEDKRTLSKSFNKTFTLNTGTADLYFTICCVSTLSLKSVVDIESANTDITEYYELVDGNYNIVDGGGNNVSYKMYVLNIASPYSSSHRHSVTLE